MLRREGPYRKANEISTFLFCQRAWMYERQGAPSEREQERVTGTLYHQQHGERVDAAQRTGRAARFFLLIAIVLLLLALLIALQLAACFWRLPLLPS